MSSQSEVRNITMNIGEDGKHKNDLMKFAKDTIMTNSGEIIKIGAFYDPEAKLPKVRSRNIKEDLSDLGPKEIHISIQDLITNEKQGAFCKFKVILF